MAKQQQVSLAIEPFPFLTWDDFFWSSTIILQAWKGFQCRLGPYGSRNSRKISDGTTSLTISPQRAGAQSPPSLEQIVTYQYLIAHQETIRDSILRAVFEEYPGYKASFCEDYDLDESDKTLPDLDRPEQLQDVLGLSNVLIHSVINKGVSYVGYEFGCDWDKEHGLGVLTYRDRVVKIGSADVSILEWIAERDVKPEEKRKK